MAQQPSTPDGVRLHPCPAQPWKLDHVYKHEAEKHALGNFVIGGSPIGPAACCDCH